MAHTFMRAEGHHAQQWGAVSREERGAFGVAYFRTAAEADAYAAHVVESDRRYCGGWFDGMPCGRDTTLDGHGLYAVTD